MMILLLLIVSVIAGILALAAKNQRTLNLIAGIGSTAIGALAVAVAVPALVNGPATSFYGAWYIDRFAAILVLAIGFVQWTATLTSLPYIRTEIHENVINFSQGRWYYVLMPLFSFAMLLTVLSNNLGLMWVALEGTTLATTMLVAFYTKEGSLEAAWKYILLCSAGISLGLIGVLLVFYGAGQSGAVGEFAAITWTGLHATASTFSPYIMRLAFVFIFIGYGVKVGIVPLHTWLPDAHGRTPSPVSGMLSGVLLNIALFAILRYKSLTDAALGGSSWTNTFFIIFGAATVIVPALFMVLQKNYKRLLAYSSIEHMGFIVFSFGLGVAGMVAGIIHMIGHALIKSMLFFCTGNILLLYKSTKFEKVSGVMRALPVTGMFFFMGMLALLAVPPSPLIVSEYRIFLSGLSLHPFFVGGLLLTTVVVMGSFAGHFAKMLFQTHETAPLGRDAIERWNSSHIAMTAHAVLIGAFGILALYPPVIAFLENIARALI